MDGGRLGDRWRQAANVFGAAFQVLGALVLPVARSAASGPPSSVDPAPYAFVIWGVIYLLALVYAVYQALPKQRTNALFRRVGWYTATAFVLCGIWEVFVPLGWLVAAQVTLVGICAFAGIGHIKMARSHGLVGGRVERWILVPAVGLLFGWTTAANVVSLTAEAIRGGLTSRGSPSEALLASALLLLGSAVATAVVVASREGPRQSNLSYPLAVLWAFVAIIVMQYSSSLLITVVALIAAVPVLAVLVKTLIDKTVNESRTAQ